MATLRGRRVTLRPLNQNDFAAWRDVRCRNAAWLTKWEPRRSPGAPNPIESKPAFSTRCAARDRESQAGHGYGFGVFIDGSFRGEANLSNVVRGACQNGAIGYWIDEAVAGNGYTPEAVCVLLRYAFEDLRLHRIQISIVPRNAPSRRVVDKLGLRCEGLAERYLEIDGVWEDHLCFAITSEEWSERRDELRDAWL